jgi:hypothetical protein
MTTECTPTPGWGVSISTSLEKQRIGGKQQCLLPQGMQRQVVGFLNEGEVSAMLKAMGAAVCSGVLGNSDTLFLL